MFYEEGVVLGTQVISYAALHTSKQGQTEEALAISRDDTVESR
jgi:hypothetical protein